MWHRVACTVSCVADVVMVNSSWTSAHIQQLWWSLKEPALVYPPCDTTDLQLLPLDRKLKHLYLASVAQFRPEKNHRLQLEAFALARQRAAGGWVGRCVGGSLEVAVACPYVWRAMVAAARCCVWWATAWQAAVTAVIWTHSSYKQQSVLASETES